MVQAGEEAFRIALIEGLERLDVPSLRRIRSSDPDRIVVSETVSRSTRRRWRDASTVLGSLPPAWPVAGRGERRGDRELRGFFAAWPGSGVPVYSDDAAWYGVDVLTGDVRWRWVVCDSGAEGSSWLDERSWIPKAVGDRRIDRLVLVLHGGPELREEAEGLLELVRDHASAEEVVLVVAFGTGRPGFGAVGGRWGEGRLRPAPLPAGGWWFVDLREDGLTITAERPLGPSVVHRWSPDAGWTRQR